MVHSGFGVFFTPLTIRGGPIDDVLDNPYVPFRLTLNRAQALAMGLNYPIDKTALQQKLIAEQNPVITSALGDGRDPYSMQWLLDVQQELKGGFVLDIGYVGTRGLRLLFSEMTNLPNRLTGVAPAPTFGEFRYYVGQDHSNYNALQTSLTRQFRSGLSMALNYTWSRALTLGGGDIDLGNGGPQQDDDPAADYGPAPGTSPMLSMAILYIPCRSIAGPGSRAVAVRCCSAGGNSPASLRQEAEVQSISVIQARRIHMTGRIGRVASVTISRIGRRLSPT